MLTPRGVGPDNAAALLITAGDNPDRLRSEASFAACAASVPSRHPQAKSPATGSIVEVTRHANAALYRIAMCRLRWDARTRNYLSRRITEGKTRREAIRCLKRYIAREIYQIFMSPLKPQPSAA
jgi:transposase